ncbi:acetolactate synthase large subunit [Pseudoruegeria sp. HB172150]|uniref:acetolactate synthase large subunit n=1 Tax=Pseudoruegeria sp. HB172150 TaxID=2721164 RepID=UPI00155313C7|nr:acetolactate synthase large subunit [Pseudoruegeria sp. HB172150]
MTQTGADALARILAENGIDTCFANPGTTEMHLLAALGREPRLDLKLCLFEGVATGAADGYARMSGKPAAVLLHLGPGFANGMANLHNAKKAATPVLNIVGEHATYHLAHDAPLTADIEGMAQTVSGAVATPQTADEVAAATAEMIAQVQTGMVGTLVVPNDAAWSETENTSATPAPVEKPSFDTTCLKKAADALAKPGALLLIGAPHISSRMAQLAHAIGAATGCTVRAEAAVARMARGGDTPALVRIPFHVDFATEALKDIETAVLVGSRPPVAFFAYPGRPSHLLPEAANTIPLCDPAADAETALQALAEAVGAQPAEPPQHPSIPTPETQAPIDAETLGQTVAALLPDQAIVVDESVTNGAHLFALCGHGPAHDWINNRGGSIGYSMPVAVGAATACPDRKVLCITGDGSAYYTLQALWTMARERLDVTVLILANRKYSILANETSKIGAGAPSDRTNPLMSLEDPAPDWVKLAEGQGVSACAAATAGELNAALQKALSKPGPSLIEVRM